MNLKIEYGFADATSRSLGNLSQEQTLKAVQDFPWEQQLALFAQSDDRVGPEVRLVRHVKDSDEKFEAYASIAKMEDASWLIVAGAILPSKLFRIFSTTKSVDIILDNQNWQNVQNFIRRFHDDSLSDLFGWMKDQE